MRITAEQMEQLIAGNRGGFWITPDGVPMPVMGIEGHAETLQSDHLLARYRDGTAYGTIIRHGGIRVSFCENSFDTALNYRTVNDAAIATLLRLMRGYEAECPDWMDDDTWCVETSYDDWNLTEYDESTDSFIDCVNTPKAVLDWYDNWTRRIDYQFDTPADAIRQVNSLRSGLRTARRASATEAQEAV